MKSVLVTFFSEFFHVQETLFFLVCAERGVVVGRSSRWGLI